MGEDDMSAGSESRSISTTTVPSDKTVTSRAAASQASSAHAQHQDLEENRLIFPPSPPATSSSSLHDHRRNEASPRWRRRVPDEEEGIGSSAEVDATTPLLLGHNNQKQHGKPLPASYSGTESPTRSVSTCSTSPHILYEISTPLEHHADLSSPHPFPTAPASKHIIELLYTARHYATPKAFQAGVVTTLQTLPAVMLGLLLNILDGVSYGFIIFPAGSIFAGFGSMGVSMFFVTCVLHIHY